MKETVDIMKAYKNATAKGQRCALATVVEVIGSSYRRAGARMLVADDGQITGAISGGCLEGDARRRAVYAINRQVNSLVTYDTTDEDDLEFGVQLGCNGIVHILFEPIDPRKEWNAIRLLELLTQNRQPAVIVTLFSLHSEQQPGTCLLYKKDIISHCLSESQISMVIRDAETAYETKQSSVVEYSQSQTSLRGLVEYVPPPIALVIVGAGNDAQPVAVMASSLGWRITIVDGRATHAVAARFPTADDVIVSKPFEVLRQVRTDDRTAFLLMTHNYNYDRALLIDLFHAPVAYIGLLGPASKRESLLNDMAGSGIHLSDAQENALHGPVGLDIGAETAEEIAISIIAEINAHFNGRTGTQLCRRRAAIHSDEIRLNT